MPPHFNDPHIARAVAPVVAPATARRRAAVLATAIVAAIVVVPGARLRHPAADAAVRAQTAARAPMTVTLDTQTVEWTTEPLADVSMRWQSGADTVFLTGGHAGLDGSVRLASRPSGYERWKGGDAVALTIDTVPPQPVTITLPTLEVEGDAAGDRIAVRGPAGASVSLSIERPLDADVDTTNGAWSAWQAFGTGGAFWPAPSSPPLWSGSAIVGPDGSAAVSTAPFDLAPGDRVRVAFRAADGDVFQRASRVTIVLLRPGAPPIARGPADAQVVVTATTSSGALRGTWSGRVAGDGRSRITGSPGAAGVQPGDVVTVEHRGTLLPGGTVTATLPTIGLVPAAAGPAAVTGPAGATLGWTVLSPVGGTTFRDVPLDASGSAPLPAGEPARGDRWAVVWRSPGGIVFSVRGLVPQARLAVGEALVRGVQRPGRPVTVTLLTPRGRPAGPWHATARSDGTFALLLTGPNVPSNAAAEPFARLAPGDEVEVDLGEALPARLTVPDVSARFEAEGARLSGQLPPGSLGTVTVFTSIEADRDPTLGQLSTVKFAHHATVPLPAGGAGRFDLALASLFDPPGVPSAANRMVQGFLTTVGPDGHAFTTAFAPPWLWFDPASLFISGFGPAGQAARVQVTDAAGRMRADVDRLPHDDANGLLTDQLWGVVLEDAVGSPFRLRQGDQISITVGVSHLAVTMPEIGGVVDVTAGRVFGRAPANSVVTTRFSAQVDDWRNRMQTVRLQADAAGRFDAPVPPELGLRYGDSAYYRVRDGFATFDGAFALPQFAIDLTSARARGYATSGQPVTVTVHRADGGIPIATGRRFVDPFGFFNVGLVDTAGRPLQLAPGDTVVRDVAGEPPVTVTVPSLTVALDAANGRAVGRAPSDGRLAVYANTWSALIDGSLIDRGWDVGAPIVDAVGAFSVSVQNRNGHTVGASALAEFDLPSGAQATAQDVDPALDIPHGGERVCGQGMPFAPVVVTATLAGGGVATGRAVVAGNGGFQAPLARADGRTVSLGAGDVVTADVGGKRTSSVLPPLTFRIDRSIHSASGEAPPGSLVGIEYPANSCVDPLAGDWIARTLGGSDILPVSADAAGRFSAQLSPLASVRHHLTRPKAFDAVLFDATGHRHFRRSRELRLTAAVHAPTVLGEADAGATVAVTVTRGTASVAHGRAVADGIGFFTATLRATDGMTVPLRAGDVVAAGDGATARRLTVPPLSAKWNDATGLVGQTDPGTVVQVRYILPVGRLVEQDADVRFTRTADAAGRFAAPERPEGGTWTLDDVRRVEVWRSFDGDDRAMVVIDASAVGSMPPAPAEWRGVGRLWLPWLGRDARAP